VLEPFAALYFFARYFSNSSSLLPTFLYICASLCSLPVREPLLMTLPSYVVSAASFDADCDLLFYVLFISESPFILIRMLLPL
jgi:hypothetical protein